MPISDFLRSRGKPSACYSFSCRYAGTFLTNFSQILCVTIEEEPRLLLINGLGTGAF